MLWLWLAGLIVRLPILWLPLLEPAASWASQSAFLGGGSGLAFDGHPWVPTGLAAIPIAFGLSPTLSVRLIAAAFGAALAPLTAQVCLRLGGSRRHALLAGLLTLVHPMAILASGGVSATTEGIAAALVLFAIVAAHHDGVGRRRIGAVAALAALLSHPVGALYAVVPLALWGRREPARAWRLGVIVVGIALLVFAPGTLVDALRDGRSGWTAAMGGGWLAAVGVVVLLPLVPSGIRALLAIAPRRAGLWMAMALVHLVLVVLGPLARVHVSSWVRLFEVGVAVVPVLAITAAMGGASWGARARYLRYGALAIGLGVSAFFSLGALHLLVAPSSNAPVAVLTQRARALNVAGQVVGPKGFIALDILQGEDAVQTSLADGLRGNTVFLAAPPVATTRATHLRRLFRFPAAGFPDDRHVAVVTHAFPVPMTVQTFGGTAIYRQELVKRFGPYLVLRARRE